MKYLYFSIIRFTVYRKERSYSSILITTCLKTNRLYYRNPNPLSTLTTKLLSIFQYLSAMLPKTASESKNAGKASWVTGSHSNTRFHVRGGAPPNLTIHTSMCGDFKVHESILCAQSPVFKAMCNGKFKVSAPPPSYNTVASSY